MTPFRGHWSAPRGLGRCGAGSGRADALALTEDQLVEALDSTDVAWLSAVAALPRRPDLDAFAVALLR